MKRRRIPRDPRGFLESLDIAAWWVHAKTLSDLYLEATKNQRTR